MTTNYVSCRQKINLVHNYDDVMPIDRNNVPCTSSGEAIMLALFSLDNCYGNTLAEIQTISTQLCPEITAQQIEDRLNEGLNQALLRSLRPPRINWLEPMPAPRYTYNKDMDRYPINESSVRYLIGITGGTCGDLFNTFFNKYKDPVDRTFRLYRNDVHLDAGSTSMT